jgi:hypothetical protein
VFSAGFSTKAVDNSVGNSVTTGDGGFARLPPGPVAYFLDTQQEPKINDLRAQSQAPDQ